MSIQHLKDGQDFGDHPDAFPESFGFSGSAMKGGKAKSMANKPDSPKTHDSGEMNTDGGNSYAKGGMHHHPHGHSVEHVDHHHDGTVVHHHAHGGYTMMHPDGSMSHHAGDGAMMHMAEGGHHPHGHEVVDVEHHHDGTVVHHHAHGGHTRHHPDGTMTHHDAHGGHVGHMAHGGIENMHDSESEYAHRAKGGDEAEDKAMVKKGIREHEDQEHHGEHSDIELAHGGAMPRIPRSFKPQAGKNKSPIETPPRNPQRMRSPRNEMPSGQMGMGVEPSAEPFEAGSDQTGLGDAMGGSGAGGMKAGGHRRRSK